MTSPKFIFVLTILNRVRKIENRNTEDYFAGNYNAAENCIREDLMKQLEKETNPKRCAIIDKIDPGVQWESCKKKLSALLQLKCAGLGILKTGEMLYCKRRGQLKCCLNDEKCEAHFDSINSKMLTRAINFQNHPQRFINNWVDNLGFDTCHRIGGYNVDKCHKDCQKLEKSPFAKKCARDGGLFKCCIRRDKEYCHNCRYCCTLSVCTFEKGSKFKFTNSSLSEAQKGSIISQAPNAHYGFSTDARMYKSYDFRCLKPKPGIPSEKWPHYEMQSFRAAKNKQELAQVPEIPFDKFFFNFEDPEVLNSMTDGTKKSLQLWKRTYGFDWAEYVPGEGSNAETFRTNEHCLREEYGEYAQTCKRNGGLFKCCIYAVRLDQFHQINYELKRRGFVKNGPDKLYCGKRKDHGHCYLGLAAHACAKKDLFTGQVTHDFQTPFTLQHRIGGKVPNLGMKFSGCFFVGSCNKYGQDARFHDILAYEQAATKEEYCNVTLIIDDKGYEDFKRNETYQKAWYDVCFKSDHPTSFICPKNNDLLFPLNEYAVKNTNNIRKLKKKLKKKLMKKKLKSNRRRHMKRKRIMKRKHQQRMKRKRKIRRRGPSGHSRRFSKRKRRPRPRPRKGRRGRDYNEIQFQSNSKKEETRQLISPSGGPQ